MTHGDFERISSWITDTGKDIVLEGQGFRLVLQANGKVLQTPLLSPTIGYANLKRYERALDDCADKTREQLLQTPHAYLLDGVWTVS